MTAACHDPVNVRTLDVSGNGLNATFGDGVTPASYPTKLAARGYYFNGNSYLNVGLAPLLDFTTTGTTVIFLTPASDPTSYRCVITKQNWTTGQNGYSVYVNWPSKNTRVDIRSGPANNMIDVASPAIDDRQAHFLSSRWTGSLLYFYFDGYQASVAQTLNASPAGWRFMLGASPTDNSYNFKGNIYFAGAWNYALSELQLRDLEARLRRELNDV
jgi:hypothetical protein